MTIRQYIKRRVRWALIAFAVVSVGAYCSVVFLRCPKCKANIGTTVVIPTAFRLFGREVMYCPYCAVSLDQPVKVGP